MTIEELDALKAGKIERKSIQTRQVHNGGHVGLYRLSWHEPGTETEVFSLGGEFVAANEVDLLAAISRFYNTGAI